MIMSMKETKKHIEKDPGFPKFEPGYSVPEGYFESFGERLKLKMEAETKVYHTRGVLFYLKPALGLAAGLAIVLTVYLHPGGNLQPVLISQVNGTAAITEEDPSDQLSNTYASLVTDGQFFSALSEMDEYDASKISKDGLAEYLVSNCTDFEILNANK